MISKCTLINQKEIEFPKLKESLQGRNIKSKFLSTNLVGIACLILKEKPKRFLQIG